jgi:dienelactone hydrolase
LKRLDASILVISKACPPWCIEKWEHDVLEQGVRVHKIYQSGAYVAFFDKNEKDELGYMYSASALKR